MDAALPERYKKFADQYLVHFNGTKAAIEAGYSKKCAGQQAARLLKNAKVQHYLKNKKKKTADRLEISQKRTLIEIARIAFSDIRNYFNEDGTLKKLTDITDDAAAAVATAEVESKSESLDVVVKTSKVKLWSKEKALEMLAKHFHLFDEINPGGGEQHNHFDLSKLSREDLKLALSLITKKGK